MSDLNGSASRPDLVVVGGSAGGVEVLKRFVAGLPADLPATVCVVLHLASSSPSLLPGILARGAAVQVLPATEDAPLVPGVVYVGVPDNHLVVVDDALSLGVGARENGYRPSVDVLLRSAALARGRRVVGVVLTGMLDDGTAGLAAVARHGGTALVQDPQDAEFPSMPCNALEATPGARALPLDALAEEVVRIVTTDQPRSGPPAPEPDPGLAQRDAAEVRSALGLDPAPADSAAVGVPSACSCPDCGGVLHEVGGEPAIRFRCRVGHAYGAASLLHSQADTVEDALWTALRAVEERQDVSRRLAAEAERSGRDWSRMHFTRRAEEAHRSADVLRSVLADHRSAADEDVAPPDALAP